jgi:hypothetical protein
MPTGLTSSENHKEFINEELDTHSKSWAGSPMESAFVVASRKCTLLQRDQIPKIAKLLISSWHFFDLADEIAGVSAADLIAEVTEQEEHLFRAIKSGVENLRAVCCQKVLSMLIVALFEEFAYALVKVLLNLSGDAQNDVQLVFDDDGMGHSTSGNLLGFASKLSFAKTFILFQVVFMLNDCRCKLQD